MRAKELGLLVVDEEQRFGVIRQRAPPFPARAAGGGVRPPTRVRRPRSRSRPVVRRTSTPLRASRFVVGRLRRRGALAGWRCVPACGEVRRPLGHGPARARHRRGAAHARRCGECDPAGPGRPPVERRHRHVREGGGRDERRRGRPHQRRGARRCEHVALPGRRRGRQPRVHAAGPGGVRARGWTDQHRCHRQLRRRRHVRPRGEHQDPPATGDRHGCARGRRARAAAGRDDRSGRGPRAGRQRGPGQRPGDRVGRGARPGGGARPSDGAARADRRTRPRARGVAEREGVAGTSRSRTGLDLAGARSAARVHEARAATGAGRVGRPRRSVPRRHLRRVLPAVVAHRVRRRARRRTRSVARSLPPSSPTRSSTAPASASCPACATRPGCPSRSWRVRT